MYVMAIASCPGWFAVADSENSPCYLWVPKAPRLLFFRLADVEDGQLSMDVVKASRKLRNAR